MPWAGCLMAMQSFFRIAIILFLEELSGFLEGDVDVRTDVVAFHQVVEAGFLQLAMHFRIDA